MLRNLDLSLVPCAAFSSLYFFNYVETPYLTHMHVHAYVHACALIRTPQPPYTQAKFSPTPPLYSSLSAMFMLQLPHWGEVVFCCFHISFVIMQYFQLLILITIQLVCREEKEASRSCTVYKNKKLSCRWGAGRWGMCLNRFY